jgi:predicted  nucleic acid-binding Zn-ribbon protein
MANLLSPSNLTTVQLVEKRCGVCGIVFAVPDYFEAECLKEGPNKTWYCPNGHGRIYTKSAADKVRQELLHEKHLREQAEADRTYWQNRSEANKRKHIAAKGRITRLRRRCVNGLCTCCGQHFADLEKHMKDAHPDAATRED